MPISCRFGDIASQKKFCGYSQPKNWLPWQRLLRDRKTDFRSFIYSRNSTNPANSVKIGLVDVGIKGLTEIVKFKKRRKNNHFISPPSVALRAVGWAKK